MFTFSVIVYDLDINRMGFDPIAVTGNRGEVGNRGRGVNLIELSLAH
jgi:hypothetical protein